MKVAIAKTHDGRYILLQTLLKGTGIVEVDLDPTEYKELLHMQSVGDTAEGRLIILWSKARRG